VSVAATKAVGIQCPVVLVLPCSFFPTHLLFERLHDGIAAGTDMVRLLPGRLHAGGQDVAALLGPQECIGVEFGSVSRCRLNRIRQGIAYRLLQNFQTIGWDVQGDIEKISRYVSRYESN